MIRNNLEKAGNLGRNADPLAKAVGQWKAREAGNSRRLSVETRSAIRSEIRRQAAGSGRVRPFWSGIARLATARTAAALGLPVLALGLLVVLNPVRTALSEPVRTKPAGTAPAGMMSAPVVVAEDLLTDPRPAEPRIEVSKENGQVVFRVAGIAASGSLRVLRSTQADRFGDDSGAVLQDGAFSDSLESGDNLTFYRID